MLATNRPAPYTANISAHSHIISISQIHMDKALDATDRCVMCGMCLPHCPTYMKTGNEAESPRGRIALMQALNNGQLGPDENLTGHIESCLQCRACEAMCPALVPYGELIDAAHALLQSNNKQHLRLAELFRRAFLKHRVVRQLSGLLLIGYQRSGLQTLTRKSGALELLGLARAESIIPRQRRFRLEAGANHRPHKSQSVALFTGCVAELFEHETLAASRLLISALGYSVANAEHQCCCGALDLHAGRSPQALTLMQRNIEAFAESDFVVSSASGCGAMLLEYPDHIDNSESRTLAHKHFDISTFLLDHWNDDVQLEPLYRHVAVHSPCSLRNVLKCSQQPFELLQKIPGIDVVELPGNELCCGAAGNYMMTHPEMADSLLQDKLEHIKEHDIDTLVSSNIGCALHLQAGLRREGLDIEVVHPVTMLARQLKGNF